MTTSHPVRPNMTLLSAPSERFPRDTRFTQSIVKHGGCYHKSTTLDEATQLKARQQRWQLMNKSKMTALSRQLHAEAAEIEQIQAQIAEQQHRVAYAALLRCCAVIIQTLWRGRCGRQRVRRLNRQRALLVICRRWLYRYRSRQLVRGKASLARCCLRH
eukprot:11096-Heterococcus_DN1.PRE.3